MPTNRTTKKKVSSKASKRATKSNRPNKTKSSRAAASPKVAVRRSAGTTSRSAASKKPRRAAATAKAVKRPSGNAKRPAPKPAVVVTRAATPQRPKRAESAVRRPANDTGKLTNERMCRPAVVPITEARPREETLVDIATRYGFAVGDHVVYPSHGVGQIVRIESHTIGEQALQMFVISFEKERMTLRVPVGKASTSGMRRLSSPEKMDAAVTALKGRARARRVMWSRRAQEYEAKLNSGDPVSIAEVVRDLHRNVGQPDQSYSERQMYEAALERLAREFAAVQKIEPSQAAERLEKVLRAA